MATSRTGRLLAALCLLLILALARAQYKAYDGVNITTFLPEVVGYDGWYNNPSHPDWGGADMQLSRRLAPNYADGTYQPVTAGRPNPHDVATATMLGGKNLKSYLNRTALLTFFGQQVVEEILDAQRPGCPPEYFNIPIPRGHENYDPNGEGGKELPFLRSRYDKTTGQSPNNPRQQLNEITPYIDGGLFYGVTKAWADALRSFVNGTMACLDSECKYPARNTIGLPLANPPPPADHLLKSARRFYKIGNPRGNENPMLLAMGVIWFRNHNHHANRLRGIYDNLTIHYNDDILFNRARQWNIAEHQHIVLNVWLPSFLGVDIPPYPGYSPSIFPGITHAFQTSAMRFGHTMVPPVAYRATAVNPDNGRPAGLDTNWVCRFRSLKPEGTERITAVRTCNSYWNSPDIVSEDGQDGVDELLFGLSKQVTEREDNIITEDLRGFVFGSLDFSRRDLMAINIQRGRDHGVPDYNTVREAYNLPRVTRFYDINPTMYRENTTIKDSIDNLMALYTNQTLESVDVNSTAYPMDNIDLWPAGLLETTQRGPGDTFTAIILDQYERIRNSDRFWFENYERNKLFSQSEYEAIRNITFRDIMTRNIKATWFQEYMLQPDVFHWNDETDLTAANCPNPVEDYDNATFTAAIPPCTPMKTFDYFEGSAGPYIGTIVALGLYLVLNVVLLAIAVKYYQRQNLQRQSAGKKTGVPGRDIWMKAGVFSTNSGTPMISQLLEPNNHHSVVVAPLARQLRVYDAVSGSVDRTIDLVGIESVTIRLCHPGDNPGLLCIRFPHRYDLVMDFSTPVDDFLIVFENFLQTLSIRAERQTMGSAAIMMDVVTKGDRKALVEDFFRILFQDALVSEGGPKKLSRFFGKKASNEQLRRQVLETELTRSEFAESMGMKDSSLFVDQVFRTVDKDNSGTINFQEFLQFVALFTTGDFDSKMELMFDIYDLDGDGTIGRVELVSMLKHLADEAGENVGQASLETSIQSMMKTAGLEHKEALTLEDFKKMFGGDLTSAEVNLTGGRNRGARKFSQVPGASNAPPANLTASTPMGEAQQFRQRLATGLDAGQNKSRSAREAQQAYGSRNDENFTSSIHVEPLPVQEEVGKDNDVSKKSDNFLYVQRVWENYRLHIFWFSLYQLVTLAIFAERAYYYSVEREHAGLRRIAGYGVTVTRGAASAMMFTYSSLLVTMSRNIITKLRETPLNRVIPFDAAHGAHKAFAMTALLYTVMHIVGHCINFYHISTQTANDLTCLFREYFHLSDELPKFQFWMFNTLTGVTGFVLTMVVITMYVFALPYARRYLFNTFWFTHHFYVVLYGLLILHGSGRLVQPPIFQWYFIAPVAIFAVDKLVSLNRKRSEIIVYKAEKLPSGVTHLQFKKPTHFNYLSGQWCRIATLALNSQEYHPFTLTSAPHEATLDLFIRAVGPWTQNVREVYDPENAKNKDPVTGAVTFPRLYLDGPFGEGHQDWYKFEVAILVGGGIGVTPFASILKDLVNKRAANSRISCKKVYFLWVTRTQKSFEWLTDIIRQVEEQDKDRLTDTHIFITQFYQKFDLRTIMLYICERHFQKISNRSLFTGLRSVTHFGRPQFNTFFEGLQQIHGNVPQIGTFSCGPPPMTRSVEAACNHCNQIEGPVFYHHYENF